MKQHRITAVLLIFVTVSAAALPETLTLSEKDFLSVSDIRTEKGPLGSSYRIPETAVSLGEDTDLLIHFDSEGEIPEGNYRLVSGNITVSSDSPKIGTGSGRFYTNRSAFSVQPMTNALLASRNEPGDFTIQFFINPSVIENDEILIYWSNTLNTDGALHYQNLICSIEEQRMVWRFERFFRNTFPKIELAGKTKIKPREWSFHRLSYNSELNLLEYSMNGKAQKILYLSPDGHEENLNCQPIIGDRLHSTLRIGQRYTGKLDELAILRKAEEPGEPSIFTKEGRILFRCIDLGYSASPVSRIEWKADIPPAGALNGYYRISENRLDYIHWNETDAQDFLPGSEKEGWIPFISGNLPRQPSGRYLQVALQLIPDTVDNISPMLSSVSVVFTPNKPPQPPLILTARPGNGSVMLDWVPSVDIRIRGYKISYGTQPGHYTDSVEIENPPYTHDHHQQYTIEGLENDTLYYFSIQPYDDAPVRRYGDFSKETSCRPGLLYN